MGLKGDLKLQARAGRLTRWFTTARKKSWNPKKPSKSSGMCCWLCGAGSLSAPFEEIATRRPAWLRQVSSNMLEPPWERDLQGGMLQASLGYEVPAKFYLPDMFHIWLMGVGQDFAASCIVYLLPIAFKGRESNNVDSQLVTLNKVFNLWRKMYKVPMNLCAFTRDRLTFPDAKKTYPSGTWPKAADTARIIQFVHYILQLDPDMCAKDSDKILHYMERACHHVGSFMKGLYQADLWIDFCLQEVYGCFPF